MALKTVCDKCGAFIENLPDSNTDKTSDYVAMVKGEVVCRYEDLCPVCVQRITDNTERYIKVSTRVRVRPGEPKSQKESLKQD
jgi:hypothetical protein